MASILLVDDDPRALAAMRRILSRDHHVRSAHDGQQALSILAMHDDVDLVLSDREMPGMDGIELLSRIRDRHPGVVRIMLTGSASLDVAVRAINEGAVERFLLKPCSGAVLRAEIGEALRRQGERREAARIRSGVRRRKRQDLEVSRDARGAYALSAERVKTLHARLDSGPLAFLLDED
ncbi:MAG: response regulator [Myxococcota bacterium]